MQVHYTSPITSISLEDCHELIDLAQKEDNPAGDITTESIFTENFIAIAEIRSKQDAILCGLPLLKYIFQKIENEKRESIKFSSYWKDGDSILKRDIICKVEAKIRTLLTWERIILNFLQYLSGISTNVKSIVQNVSPNIAIIDTRKTLPAYRRLAKYAVCCGGGSNHRIHLGDLAMIKDNHISVAGSIKKAIEAVKRCNQDVPIELEIQSLEQLDEALRFDLDVILLDNMERSQIFEAKAKIDKYMKRK